MAKDKIQFTKATPAADTQKAAEDLRKNLDVKYGKGTLMRMGDRVGHKIDTNPTGIYSLDYDAIQAGGVPAGRIVEIYGPESSGKTTITLQIIAQAQKRGKLAGFVDAEHALDPNWATVNGVDMDELMVSQPDYGEQALEIVEDMVRSGAFGVIVVDSVAALVPKAELAGEMGDSHVGLQARLMSQALRKLTAIVASSKCTVIFINQLREKIGVMFGSPETTSGGKALKFYASVRIDVRRIGQVKDGDEAIGARTKFKIVKNKVGAPFRETEVDLLFATGYDVVGNLVEAAVKSGVVEKTGAWYNYKGERLGQGIKNVSALLRDNTELFDTIYAHTVQTDIAAAEAKTKKVTI